MDSYAAGIPLTCGHRSISKRIPPRSPRLKLRTDNGCTGRTYLHDLHIVRQSAGLALEPVSFDETAAWRRSQLPDTDTDPSRCTCAKDGYTDRARLARCGIVQYSYVATYCRACLSVDVLLSEGTNRDRHGYITGALHDTHVVARYVIVVIAHDLTPA